MPADFDIAAKAYDQTFTQSVIGRRQRRVVWDYLETHFRRCKDKLSILELNCGTGEDAKHLGELGHTVLATDISTGMLSITQGKCKALSNITTQLIDLTKLEPMGQKFDLIFSNFGGLNCLDKDQLRQFATWSRDHLNDGGSLMMVIMPRDTLIEKWYRQYKGDHESLRLRQSQTATEVNVDGQSVKTYFFNPDEVTELFSDFEVVNVKATGYVPSYWSGHRLQGVLLILSRVLRLFRVNARYGDHYLVEMRRP